MEERILPYVDGRVKESERREMEAHLAACATCRLRARVAAEPVKQSWWAWLTPSPRVAFAASLLLLGTVWIGANSNQASIAQEDLPVLENYDVLSNFEPLTELPQPVQADETNQQNQQM
jgi:anti-sigma factor RsiW